MKKIILSIAILCFVGISAQAQVTIWEDGFESPDYVVGDTLHVVNPLWPTWSGVPFLITDTVAVSGGTQCAMSETTTGVALNRYDSLYAGHEYTFIGAHQVLKNGEPNWKANHSFGIMANMAVTDTAFYIAEYGIDTTMFLFNNDGTVRIYNQIDNPDPFVEGDYVKFIYTFDPAAPGTCGRPYAYAATEEWQVDTFTFTVMEGVELAGFNLYRWAEGVNVLVDEFQLINNTAVPISEIVLNNVLLQMTVGATDSLEASLVPEDATYPFIEWSSSNEGVATVDSTGKVTAVALGLATITAKSVYGDVAATANVIVSETSSVVDAGYEDVTIYPNPVMDKLLIDGLEMGTHNVVVYDVLGKVQAHRLINSSETTLTLSLEGLTPGTYLLNVSNGKGAYVAKFLKL